MNIKNTLKLAFASALVLGVFALSAIQSHAGLPWGTIYDAPTGTASPVCTSFASAPVCILDMTASITSLTISGDPGATNNHQATLIMQQDGTGGRVFPSAIASFTGLLPSPASTAANKYTAYVLQYNTTSNLFSVVGQYDNYSLSGFEFYTTQAAAAATMAPATTIALTAQDVPGETVSNTCLCVPQISTVNVQLSCIPGTNTVQCVEQNATNATVTATTVTLNVRGLP